MASVGNVRVALVVLRAFAHIAEIETITRLADGRVDAVAVVTDARIVRWWPLAFLWARGVSVCWDLCFVDVQTGSMNSRKGGK